MYRSLFAGALAAFVTSCSPPAGDASEAAPNPGEPTLEEVREANARFQDVNVALAEGYLRDPMDICETAEMMGFPPEAGAMGVHYFRPDLLGITEVEPRVNGVGTHTDFLNPAVLLYEPQADGSMELIGVENLVWGQAWAEAGNTEPPSFHGIPYEWMENDPSTELDEGHGFEPHYDRHVWVFRENPSGVFAPFNPAVTCEHHEANERHPH